jgi:tetratricopeptide (TPR) repeat protein
MLYYLQGDRKQAVRWLEEAVERNPDLVSAYPLLVTAYRGLGMPEKAAAVEARRKARLAAGAGEEHFRKGLQAYSKMQLDEAVAEFGKALAVNPSNPATWSNLGYVHYDKGDLARAFEHQRKALVLDPGYASAHYGLALIAKKRGDLQAARSEWEEYLRLEPEGYFSRKAREELKAIDSRR